MTENYYTDEITVKGDPENLFDFFWMEGFNFNEEVLTDYLLSLKTKPFVLLTGISGTGKTKIAQLFVDYLYQDEGMNADDYKAFIPVRPDWTDNRGLLGYYNPLDQSYHSTPVLDMLLRAKQDPDHPYFIILDEMNLAKVEYYFSDFLSIMESRTGDSPEGDPLQLYEKGIDVNNGGDGEGKIPDQLHMPSNVFIIGTVNVDESTYMFSPKVLDRANVIEFNEVRLYDSDSDSSRDDSFRLRDPVLERSTCLSGERFASRTDYDKVKVHVEEPLGQLLNILSPYHLHFGYRVINELSRFVSEAKDLVGDSEEAMQAAMDIQILQKILPKFHGTRAKLEKPLGELLDLCYGNSDDALSGKIDGALAYAPDAPYPRSAQKIARMLRTLDEQGYASFIE